MSNWAENPRHREQSLKQASLSHLLFTQCHKFCIDDEFQHAETAEQKTCISNCHDKTYKAFDMYMGVSERFAARKTFRSYVDISRFTGMEVEHKHDTDNAIAHNQDGHINPKSIEDFQKTVTKSYGDIQKKALN